MSSSFPLDQFRLRVAGETDKGRKRSHNEDCLYLPVDERLIMVADGMGGHACGDVASRMAVDTVVEHFQRTAEVEDLTWPFYYDRDNRRHENRLLVGFKLANLKIFEAARQDEARRGMGTTMVAGLFCDAELILGHVGDSRAYRLRDGRLTQMTEDHSLLNDYIRLKRLSPADAERFPHKNVIVRALGMRDVVAVDTVRDVPQLGDVYLLCSDGLSGMLSDAELLATLLEEHDLDRCCELLVERANGHGGVDNITVALARLEEQAL